GESPVHVSDLLGGNSKMVGERRDMLGRQVAFLDRVDLVFGFAQVEEELLLVGRRTEFDEAPRAQDVFLDRGTNPPHRICRKTEALVRFEALDRLHKTDISFGNDLGDW